MPSIPLLIALALTNGALALGAMYLAAGQAEAAVAPILAGGQPLVLAAAGWALFGERLSGRTITGLSVAMVGAAFVATTGSGATSPDGVALALLATAAPAAAATGRHVSGLPHAALRNRGHHLGKVGRLGSATLDAWRRRDDQDCDRSRL